MNVKRGVTAMSPAVVVFLAVGLFLPVVSAIDFGPKTGAVLYGFQTRGAPSENGTQWELSGARATIGKAWYRLDDFKLILHQKNGEKIVLTSPRCRYDEISAVAESAAPVLVVGDTLTLRGIGYDMLLDKKRLRIRSQVRMTVRRALGPDGGFGFGPGGGTASETKKVVPASDKRKDCGEKR